ncbi:MAG: sodium:solute symporter [Dehalococcoidia bacterium]|nr:MAG: sodium:solute symporter [Dehalococcoidia bacterium]
MQTLWLVYFYAPPPESGRSELVPLALFSTLIAVGRLIEAFDDLAIGHWSDVTRTRWGRRLPFIAGGAPLVGLCFLLLWAPPPLAPEPLALYVFLLVQAYFLVATIVQQPYEAVLAELSADSAVRVRVSAWKVAFGVLGAAVGLIGSGLAIERLGFLGAGAIFALLGSGSILLSALGVWRLPAVVPAESISLRAALRLTLTNTQFLVYVTSATLFFLGLNLLTLLLPYFVTVLLGQPEGLVSLFTAVFTGVALLMLPLVTWAATRFGKARTFRTAMVALGVLLPGLFWVGSWPGLDPLLQMAGYVALLGVPMAALFVLPNPLIADIIDDEARRTGLRREGIYYAADVTVRKFGFALSTALFGAVLATFGFSPDNPLGIRLIGPLAGIGVLIGVVVFSRGYRLADPVAVPSK